MHNPVISDNFPSKIYNITGLVELELSFTYLNGNTPSMLGLLKDICYQGMDETYINGRIPANMDNTQKIK